MDAPLPHLQAGCPGEVLERETMNYRMKELLEAVVIGMCIFACILVWGCLIAGCRADAKMKQFAPRHSSQASLKGYSYSVESSVTLKRDATRGASLSQPAPVLAEVVWKSDRTSTLSNESDQAQEALWNALETPAAGWEFDLSEGREPIPKTAGFPIPSSFSTLV